MEGKWGLGDFPSIRYLPQPGSALTTQPQLPCPTLQVSMGARFGSESDLVFVYSLYLSFASPPDLGQVPFPPLLLFSKQQGQVRVSLGGGGG